MPPYLQVAEIIRSQIRSGKLPAGSRITEAEITETYEVARSTAPHAGRPQGREPDLHGSAARELRPLTLIQAASDISRHGGTINAAVHAGGQ